MLKHYIIFLFFPLILISCSKSDKPTDPKIISISDLLPQDSEISGWLRKTGSDASWRAVNASELQQHINGGFELFANHGFVEAAMQKYSGKVNTQSNVEAEVQVYDQGSSSNADAVFDDPNNTFANPILPSNPPSSKAMIRKDLFSYTMKFSKAKYYVLITIYSNDDKAQDLVEVFAGNIASRIK